MAFSSAVPDHLLNDEHVEQLLHKAEARLVGPIPVQKGIQSTDKDGMVSVLVR